MAMTHLKVTNSSLYISEHSPVSIFCLHQSCCNVDSNWLFVSFPVFRNHPNLRTSRHRHRWLSCMYRSLPHNFNPTHSAQLTSAVLPPGQNPVPACRQIIFIILYQVSTGQVTLLQFSYDSVQWVIFLFLPFV